MGEWGGLSPRDSQSSILAPASFHIYRPVSNPLPPYALRHSPLAPRMNAWLHRAVLGGLLLAAYLWAWTPARTAWVEHGAAPLLTLVAGPESTVTARPAAHTVRVAPSDGDGFTYRAPGGVKFLLPGLFLVVIAPARPRLGGFFAGHLALGVLALGLAAAGTTGLPGGLGLAGFVQTYGVDTYSLAVPVLVFARRRSGVFS